MILKCLSACSAYSDKMTLPHKQFSRMNIDSYEQIINVKLKLNPCTNMGVFIQVYTYNDVISVVLAITHRRCY